MLKPIDLTAFPKEREQKLRSIYRYSMFEVMYYRSDLWMHSLRVFWLTEELLPLAQKHLSIDPEKARTLAFVHDDAEIVMGDIQAGHKLRMSEKELKDVEKQEEHSIDILAKKYPEKINGYAYKDLLLHASRKDCIEAQFVSYLDKLDALCESLHELLAGNITLVGSVMMYASWLTDFPQKYPVLAPLLKSKESPLTFLTDRLTPMRTGTEIFAHLNKPFTKETITIDSNFPFYNTWRRLVLERGGKEGLAWLITQNETL